MSPFAISLLLLAVMVGILLLFHMRPTPARHLYAVFDTNEDAETFEHEIRKGVSCANEMNAIPVLLLSADHSTEIDAMLRLLVKEYDLQVLRAEQFSLFY